MSSWISLNTSKIVISICRTHIESSEDAQNKEPVLTPMNVRKSQDADQICSCIFCVTILITIFITAVVDLLLDSCKHHAVVFVFSPAHEISRTAKSDLCYGPGVHGAP